MVGQRRMFLGATGEPPLALLPTRGGTSFSYEPGVHTPSTAVLIRIAEFFEVSLDYLAFDDRPDTRAGTLIADGELVEKPAAIDRLSERDKETVKAVLDTFIVKDGFQELARDQQAKAMAS